MSLLLTLYELLIICSLHVAQVTIVQVVDLNVVLRFFTLRCQACGTCLFQFWGAPRYYPEVAVTSFAL